MPCVFQSGKLSVRQNGGWRDVLTHLISIIQSLAERNLALRGSVDTLHQANNGNFIKEVEPMAKFDPVLRDHVRGIDSGAEHITYLGKTIQNELIACVSNKMLDTMVSEIKDFKYYAIILCSAPDVSHQELFWKCGKNLHTLLRIPSKVGHLEEACERHTQVLE